MTQDSLFPDDDLRRGAPARWRDLERRENKYRKGIQGAHQDLLPLGWVLKVKAPYFEATHKEHGTIRSLRLELLIARARAFVKTQSRQLTLL